MEPTTFEGNGTKQSVENKWQGINLSDYEGDATLDPMEVASAFDEAEVAGNGGYRHKFLSPKISLSTNMKFSIKYFTNNG